LLPTSLSKKIKDLIFALLQYSIRLEKGYFLGASSKNLKYSTLAGGYSENSLANTRNKNSSPFKEKGDRFNE